jgi:hypothetical protein
MPVYSARVYRHFEFCERYKNIAGTMKVVFMVVLLASSALPVLTQENAATPFTIVISPEKPTVKAGSDVWIKVQLTNNSSEDLDLSGSVSDLTGLDSNLNFEVRDDLGKLAPKRVHKHPELAGGRANLDRILKSGQSLTENQNISRLHDMTQPGKYVIRVSRRLSNNPNDGVVKSNTITVTVTPSD